MPSSAGGNIPSLNSDDTSNGGGNGGGAAGEHVNNNNEVCDVPDDVANQKRHVSITATVFALQLIAFAVEIKFVAIFSGFAFM